jgi:hypothetical protein
MAGRRIFYAWLERYFLLKRDPPFQSVSVSLWQVPSSIIINFPHLGMPQIYDGSADFSTVCQNKTRPVRRTSPRTSGWSNGPARRN